MKSLNSTMSSKFALSIILIYSIYGCTTSPTESSKTVNSLENIQKEETQIKATPYPDGGFYKGGIKNGKRHGFGIYKYPDGATYEGQWKNGRKEGYGISVAISGNRYEGEWKQGKQNGRGLFIWTDGGITDAYWKNGQVIRLISKSSEENFFEILHKIINNTWITQSPKFKENFIQLINNPEDYNAQKFFGLEGIRNLPETLLKLKKFINIQNISNVSISDLISELKMMVPMLKAFGKKEQQPISPIVQPAKDSKLEAEKFISEQQAGFNLLQLIDAEGDISLIPSKSNNVITLEHHGKSYEFQKNEHTVLNIAETIKRVKPNSKYINERYPAARISYSELITLLTK